MSRQCFFVPPGASAPSSDRRICQVHAHVRDVAPTVAAEVLRGDAATAYVRNGETRPKSPRPDNPPGMSGRRDVTMPPGLLGFGGPPHCIIDCHIHFYDPFRPGHSGLGQSEGLHHRTCLTSQCLALCGHLGVAGAILVECSAPVDDNQWLLDLSDTDQFIVGVVGHIDPGPSFCDEVDRFAKHPRFCGIRASGCSVVELTHLRDSGLQLDHIGGPPDAIHELCEQLRLVPGLRVVINHMAQPGPFSPPRSDATSSHAPQPSAEWLATIRAAAAVDGVFMKVSAVFEAAPGTTRAPIDLGYYLPHLEALWEAFGSERLIYGSNWPVCDRCGDPAKVYGEQLSVLREFFGAKGVESLENYFWRNALRAYRYSATGNHRGSWYKYDKQA
jgi:L-fuconolactonase